MFMLVDPELPAKVMAGLSMGEARELLSTIPFDIAVALRPMLVDPAQMTAYLLTAHLIVFWLSQDSNVTPPVCLAAFTAAGIAGSKPMATGVEAWKIAKGLYIVPLMFAYTPMIGAPVLDLTQDRRVCAVRYLRIECVDSTLRRRAAVMVALPFAGGGACGLLLSVGMDVQRVGCRDCGVGIVAFKATRRIGCCGRGAGVMLVA